MSWNGRMELNVHKKVEKSKLGKNLQFWLRNGWFLGLRNSLLMGLVKASISILRCMVGELAGGGAVDVAVGVSDILQVTVDTQNMQP